MADVAGSEEELGLTSFRPYQEHLVMTRPKGNKPIEINVGSKKIVFQKTPPTTRKEILRNPPNGTRKQQPRVHSLQPQPSTTSLSEVSAVGTITSSTYSHRSLVEEQIDKLISSKVN